MAALRYAPAAVRDLQRLGAFLQDSDPRQAQVTAALIERAILILKDHPLIGRRADADFRELVISRGRTGYVALYVYDLLMDEVRVLAVRHQRECGYGDGDVLG